MTESRVRDRPARATFTEMKSGTREDYELIAREMTPYVEEVPNRVLAHLRLLAGDHSGFPIDRFEHSLQTATRALRDGRDEEYVVCALLHDIGDTLASHNHPEIAAAILKPYVSEANHFMVAHHGIFQGHHYFHHYGLDRDLRERYRSSPHFAHCEEFCLNFDQAAFDPHYDTLPLSAFEPMVHRLFAQVKNSIFTAA